MSLSSSNLPSTAASATTVAPPSKTRPAKPVDRDKDAMDAINPPANSWALWRRGLDWPTVVWIGLAHLAALAAPFFFSWQALTAFLVLYVITGSLGICMGYHRLLTHGSFQTFKPIRWLLAFLGGLSGEGSALTWVANHRKHHKYSDKDGDPHSPRHGKWWSHMFWFMPNRGLKWNEELLKRYAPDMLKDRGMLVLHKLFLPSHVVLGLGLYALGYYGTALGMGGHWYGCSMLIWGLALRMVYLWCLRRLAAGESGSRVGENLLASKSAEGVRDRRS